MGQKAAAYRDFDKIYGNLYVGAYPDPEKLAFTRKFDTIVLAAVELQPPTDLFASGTEIIRAPMKDGELTARQELAARMAAQAVADRLRQGKSVLVTCAAGVNRSALIAAMAVVMVTGRPGWWALNHLRATRRPRSTIPLTVLQNSEFAGYLLTITGVKQAVRAS